MSAMINGVRYTYYPGGGGRGAFYEAKFETEEERKKAKEQLEKAAKTMNRNVDFAFSYHEYLEEKKLGVSVPLYPFGYGAEITDGFPLGITEEGVKKLETIKVAQINQEGGKRRKSKRKSSKKSKRHKSGKRKSSKRKRSKRSRRRR